MISTRSGSQYLLELDGDEHTVIRLAVDDDRFRPDGSHPLRRDGEALPLLGLVIGNVTDEPGYVSTTRATKPVVEIRRVG